MSCIGARRGASSGISPHPADHDEAVAQVRGPGVDGVHLGAHLDHKPAGANFYTRWEVIGWGVRYGRSAVRVGAGVPDGYWFGSPPMLLADAGRGCGGRDPAGEGGDGLYPYGDQYAVCPVLTATPSSPCSAAVTGVQVDLPPTAIGKDFLDGGVARTPSGTGWQVSLAVWRV